MAPTASPPAASAPAANAPATIAPAQLAASSVDVSGTWPGLLAAWLQAHKTYPEAARRDGVEGRVIVRFSLDRQGAVREVTIIRSSGSPELDEAAAAMLRGARLPPPPASSAETVSITLPIRYSLGP